MIGICSTVFGDVVCRGCKRFVHEIINWNAFNNSEKALIEKRLVDFLTQVMESRVRVVNAGLLHAGLDQWQINYNPAHNDLCHAYSLLGSGGKIVNELADFGIQAQPGYEKFSVMELKEEIDEAYFALSEAHYQRYFDSSYVRSDEADVLPEMSLSPDFLSTNSV
jgi:predicted Fe-S protein YdhL (DUF1289 family)